MIPKQDQQDNLEYLRYAFLEHDRTSTALRHLRRVREGEAMAGLEHLLRDHRQDEAISNNETYQRDAFDFLLSDYGILEIACLIKYVSEPLPLELAETARWNLSCPAVLTYYRESYPVLLPELFHRRLVGAWTLHEDIGKDPTQLHHLFCEFLGLVNAQRNDEAMDIFLWFLDDGWRDGYSIDDTIAELRNPETLISRIVKPPPDRDTLDVSVRGFQNFVTLCISLDELLQRSAVYRYFQSAQWYHYAYWFECIRETVGDSIDKAFEQILNWSPKGKNESEIAQTKRAIVEYVATIRKVLKRLLSGEYGIALREQAEKKGSSAPEEKPARRAKKPPSGRPGKKVSELRSTRVASMLVSGDIVIDHQIYVGQKRRPASTLRLGTRESATDGGAALLHDLLQSIAKARTATARPGEASASGNADPNWQSLELTFGLERPTECALPPTFHGYAVFQPCSKNGRPENSNKVWRLLDPLGFGDESAERYEPQVRDAVLDSHSDIVVIDDAGLGFRIQSSREAWPRCIRNPEAKWPEWLVLKLSAPIAAGDFWRTLLAMNIGPERLAARCVAVVSINDLRAEGVQVSHALSWERSALDLVAEWDRHPQLRSLSACRYVIVSFHTDGALLADCSSPDTPVFRLLFDPAHLEGDWADRLQGTLYGLQTCMAASVIAHLPDPSGSTEGIRSGLERGIKAGLAGMRRLLLEGHGPVSGDSPGFPFAAVASEILRPTWQYSATGIPNVSVPERERWTVLQGDDSPRGRQAPLLGVARRVALRGPAELHHVPYQQFGDLFVIERNEIESLRSLRRLVRDYSSAHDANKPLSIAVFGPPGAGKSFGVKQIARSVLGAHTPILEFNLAQFADPGELVGLLHQVRDKVLEGRLPVVFWDEFDTNDLSWLQFMLAPMQDGRFQDGQVSHPVGKCIFVFAGGTSYDFQSFSPRPPSASATDREKQRWEHFKSKKGPDFISRLSGFLNVLGPNQRQLVDHHANSWQDDPSDVSYPVRRALFVRAKLSKSPTQRLLIDPGILRALLEVSRYFHGSRSLEKLLEQLRQSSKTGVIVRADLPPAHLLGLHVDPNEFLRIVGRDISFGDVETMAEEYHKFYQASLKNDEPLKNVSYNDLPEYIKDDNRDAVRRVAEVLSHAGLYLAKSHASTPASTADEIDTIIRRNIEILAEAEHDGWMEAKLRQGWRYAPVRNNDLLLHNLLIPYCDLPEDEKDKDRSAIRGYPETVARRGFRIISEPPENEKSPEPNPVDKSKLGADESGRE